MGAKRTKRSLGPYRDKRDVTRTNEPFDAEPVRSGGATRNGVFVVHEHAARRLHYDLRLEMSGVLVSFAVPKGPSLDPKEKRLAIQTEDHPLSYLDFESVIPEGNYGAGAMIAWDQGRVRYLESTAEEGLASGKIDFALDGMKLRGRFALVRTKPRAGRPDDGKPHEWLLLKKEDAFSREGDLTASEPWSVLSGLTVEELRQADARMVELEARAKELGATEADVEGRRISPMLCSLDGVDLEADGYYYELKLDGVRILAEKRGDRVSLTYRTGRPATATYPEIAKAIRAMAPDHVVLDGEIVAFDEKGRPSFQLLSRRIQARRPSDVSLAMASVPVTYFAFDVLAIGDHDVRGLTLRDRKALLSGLVRGKGYVRALDHIEANGRVLYDFCVANGLEGVVAKRAASKYREGPKRFPDWVKIKTERDAEFVVVGYTKGDGSRARLGALDLASYDENGDLVVRGKVGSGLDEAALDALAPELESLAVKKPRAKGTYGPQKAGRVHVTPKLVVSVRYLGWSDDGVLRFPVFRGVRPDIPMEACRTHPPLADDAAEAMVNEEEVAKEDSRVAGQHKVPLTNQTKVFWPDEGYTKGDLCDYYDAVAPTLLPYLDDRPVVLVRYPDGIRGKSFYQWRVPRGAPPWVRSFPLESEDGDGLKTTFIVGDVDTLLFIANLGCIPIHVLAARTESLERPDFITVDFDIEDRPLRDAIVIARTLREILETIGLTGYPKTSGQRGLHVHVAVGATIEYRTAKILGELLGRILVTRHPDLATMERIKERRQGKIYLDVFQIGRSRTIVAPYSVRAVPGATVATPLSWDEVAFALDPRAFTIRTVPERIARFGDPMKHLLDDKPDVRAAIEKLAPLVVGG